MESRIFKLHAIDNGGFTLKKGAQKLRLPGNYFYMRSSYQSATLNEDKVGGRKLKIYI